VRMTTIYHLLDERESFSERDGGAISRWAGNVLCGGDEIVVCPSYDLSWKFPSERIYQLPRWDFSGPIHRLVYRHRLPWKLQEVIYRTVFRPLLQKLKEGDIVYVHNRPQYAAVLATLATRVGARVVLHMHNSHLVKSSRGQLAALRNVPVVFCSEFLRREADTALPNHFQKTWVVYNGADGSLFRSAEQRSRSTPTVIFTGRLQPYKGVHILMEAMRILQARQVDVKCMIVGASGFGRSKGTRYTRHLRRLKPENTELVGYKSGEALASLLGSADIFCAPSIFGDPFPLAPVEAMAVGLPVVASNVGGLPEALAYGGGVLVPPEDPEALARVLESLLGDLRRREELGREAYACFKSHFTWNNVRNQYQRVVQSMTS